MDGIPIAKRKTLKILGFTFDSKGLWSAHIEQTVKEARQRLGAINRVKHYLKDDGVCIAYKAFVHSKMEYGNLIYGMECSRDPPGKAIPCQAANTEAV